MYTLGVSDIRQVFLGGKVLACGGGGEIEWAEPILKEMEEKGLRVRIASLDDLRSKDNVCVPGGIGAGSTAEVRERLRTVAQIAPPEKLLPTMARVALDSFEKYTETKFDKFLAVNVGPVLWGLPLYLAALRKVACLDGDCAGRAIPEWTTTTLNVKRLRLAPAIIVSAYGDEVSIRSTKTNERTEQVGRAVAVECGGWCVMMTCPTIGVRLRNAFVPGTITKAHKVGAAIAEARKKGRDPIDPCLKAAQGTRVFEGRIISHERKEHGGFMFGEVLVKGSNVYSGKTCRIYQKTEYNIAWINDKVVATCPDSICIVDRHTAEGLTSFPDVGVGPFQRVRDADLRPGREIVVFGIRAHPLWRTKRGIELFGPKHFGFNIPYIPVDQRVRDV